jgi:hypothetical protein
MDDPLKFLESLADVLTGEEPPYKEVRLLNEKVDPSRKRALLASASSKHERLFKLLDVREFDLIKVLVPASTSPRSRVATHAAEIICQNHANSMISKIDMTDLEKLVISLDREYLDIYRRSGFNVEIGLTGSKRQAIAAAILSVTRKIGEAWYVKPNRFDENRFTEGVGSVAFHEIRIPALLKNDGR